MMTKIMVTEQNDQDEDKSNNYEKNNEPNEIDANYTINRSISDQKKTITALTNQQNLTHVNKGFTMETDLIDCVHNSTTIGSQVSATSFATNTSEKFPSIEKQVFNHSDENFLTVNRKKFDTVSLNDIEIVSNKKEKIFQVYKTKFKSKLTGSLINKLTQNKTHNMERLVNKNGQANINRINIESRRRKYISDLFNTIVDMKWSYILAVFVMSFVVSWTFFGIFWFVISNLSSEQCISNINNDSSFFESFLFSIETQQTIGYGFRYITHDCKFSIIVLMIQCAFSVFLESFLGGVVFAKLSRPKKRTETLIFSKQALIAPRDGVYNLMVRVGDLRKSHIILAYVKMYLIRTRYTSEGECIPCEIQELLVSNLANTDLLLFMPIIVSHTIDEKSPLFKMISFSNLDSSITADQFLTNDFEILVTLEGTVESTGNTTQARTSYLPTEVFWNHVFEPILSVSHNNSKATIDFSQFNNTKSIVDLNLTYASKRKFSIFTQRFSESTEDNSKGNKVSIPLVKKFSRSESLNRKEEKDNSIYHLVNL